MIVSILPIATILKLLIFTSYNYWTTFLIIEGWKLSIVFGKKKDIMVLRKKNLFNSEIGVVNSLSILQFCYIFEIEYETLRIIDAEEIEVFRG